MRGAAIETLAKRLHDLADEILKPKAEFILRAKNDDGAQNAALDYQKIQTAEIEVPVIYATVLAYKGGELGYATDFARRGGKVWYTPEAVSDPEFLETVRRAPFSVATHEKNSSESNRDIDGWPTEAWWDENQKCTMVKGFVVGADNVEYTKENRTAKNFGSSADLSFIKLDIVSGTTPDGQEYDAKVVKLCCNHVAILPNIRDPKNTIRAINATHLPLSLVTPEQADDKNQEKVLTAGQNQARARSVTTGRNNTMADEKDKDTKAEVRSALEDLKKEEAAANMGEEIKSLSARMSDIEKRFEGGGTPAGESQNKRNAKNEADNGKNEEADNEEADNEDGENDEAENAKNGAPAQATIAAFSQHFGVDFGKKTPSFRRLGKLIGIEKKPFGEILTAVNAKRVEIESTAPMSAQNSSTSLPGTLLSKLG